jgi:putative transposase
MKRSKFTDSQIMDALKRVDAGLAVPEVCRELSISTATFYKWRAKYGGMLLMHLVLRTSFFPSA